MAKKNEPSKLSGGGGAGGGEAPAPSEQEKELLHTKAKQDHTVSSLQDALKDGDVKSVIFGVVGVGQGGSRLAEEFFNFGYPACCINTAEQDLAHINLPDDKKMFIDYSLGGVGKDLSLGEEAIRSARENIYNLLYETFYEKVDSLILTIGGGGGTGSGSAVPMVETLAAFGLPVTVLYTLPMSTEDAVTKSNAIQTLDKIARMASDNLINGVVVIDNARIEQIYPSISAGQFWKVANFDIVNVFNMFNTLSACATKYISLDPMDFSRIITTGNCMVYGKTSIPIQMHDGELRLFPDEIALALTRSLSAGLLAEGFDLAEAVRAGIIFTAKESILDQIPAAHINYAFQQLNEMIGGAGVFRGIYRDDSAQDELTIYSIFSGLGLPKDRVTQLVQEAEDKMAAMEAKEADKSKMSVIDSIQTSKKEQDLYSEMKKQSSGFGKTIRNTKRRRGRG